MTDQLYALRRRDGTVARQGVGRAHPSEREDGVREFRVDRLGDLCCERLNGRGVWYRHAASEAVAVDRAFAADFGTRAKQREYDVKVLEARVILAGVMIDGLVAAEAAATDRDVVELARVIDQRDRDSAIFKARVGRRQRKISIGA